MKTWLIWVIPLILGCPRALWAQTNEPAPAQDKEQARSYYALEKLIVEPVEIGLDARRTIDGMVINVKSPVKIVANDSEMRVTSSEFRDKNLKFAALGMHSWLSVSYKIIEENDKQVTFYVMEFETPKHARRFWQGENRADKEEEENKELEMKGSVFYQFLHGSILLKVTWPEPKTPGIDKIVAAYKSKMLLM